MGRFEHINKQSGVVSLFVVIFTALLITIVTISFVQIMLRNQQEASTADLSQSAYDSALAGVEDAKRALVAAQSDSSIADKLDGQKCNSVKRANDPSIGVDDNSEVLVQQNLGADSKLDQAYTCVKVNRTPLSIPGSLNDGSSEFIPLTTKDNVSFDSLEVSWRLPQDDSSTTPASPSLRPAGDFSLPKNSNDSGVYPWGENVPAILRTQLVQFGDNFTLGGFDTPAGGLQSDNTRTKFLYPSTVGSTSLPDFNNDTSPTPVDCDVTATFTCSITIRLPAVTGTIRHAYLRLTALYNGADYQIVAKDSSDPNKQIQFSNVIATVDSTGRTSDVFRRVNAVVKLYSSFPYPEAALDLDGNLCKTFVVGDSENDYASGDCDPGE